ncbi:MAG: PAS domain-containing protein, partial [Desulfotignum sp.]|nr:PAS domain-containing protein [Desulfotignum sp.]
MIWSDETYKIFGQSPETFKVTVESFEKMIHPDDYQKFLAEREAALKDNRGVDLEHRIVLPDNRVRWVHEISSAVKDETDKIVKITGTVQDITQRKKLQAQLTQAQKMESVGRLAGGVAHDFNNMLGVILGHVELALEKTGENYELNADLKEIQTAAQRSADLTKQLLTFARKDIICPRRLDLNDTVESMLNMLRRVIGEDIDLIWKPGASLWSVKMDPSQIDQILVNLCVNARDAIDRVGRLTIETGNHALEEKFCSRHPGSVPGEYVLLAVSDNGGGMDKNTLDNLFEPFFT